jgi:PAS domain S-box-containing protein
MDAPFSAQNPVVLLLDGHGNILRWSPAFRQCARQPLEALLGNVGWELLFQGRDAATLGNVLAHCRTKSGETTEHWWTTRGDPFDKTWSALTIANPSGLIEFVVLTGVRSEANPERVSTRPSPCRALADAPSGTWAFDRGTYRLLAVNEATTHRYGYTPDELRSMRMLDLSPWVDVPRVVARVTDLAPGKGTYVRWRLRRKDGGILDLEARVVATESAGRPACLVFAGEDARPSPGSL